MTFWKKIEQRLRIESNISESQLGFMQQGATSTTEAMYMHIRLMEKYREITTNLHMISIDLEKRITRCLGKLCQWPFVITIGEKTS